MTKVGLYPTVELVAHKLKYGGSCPYCKTRRHKQWSVHRDCPRCGATRGSYCREGGWCNHAPDRIGWDVCGGRAESLSIGDDLDK